MKNFVCVKFKSDESTNIVHKNWMINSTSCMWPPSGSDIQKLARNAVSPFSDWKSYNCTIICKASELYWFLRFREIER